MSDSSAHEPAPVLTVIQAGIGNTIHMVPVADVLAFDAANKYVRLLTADSEFLIRTPLKELLPQLPRNVFCQIHRSTVVRRTAIARVQRDEGGRMFLCLHHRPERWPVSRMHAPQFKAM